jgi:hypothetical protein
MAAAQILHERVSGGDDPRGPAGRDVAQAGPGSCAMHSSTRAWLVRKAQFATISMLANSGKLLLVSGCRRSVRDTHRTSAAKGGQLPGLPEERMPIGLIIIMAVDHGRSECRAAG